ncbi:uncharacterized protein PITG_03959 [Phytophthora infestans T30-4]|uniref:protein-serine/threonine phosphatase n=1 Tax=Phytophthora infestans (strain T30-4) TaxID=403677 RepID=D0MYZ5_PHYIT|nr:uncharacterized protein PITG_03959 [Phytophthora infestans T30-4]EEY66393.1 conserved hypothetical protein [Phytophthora infestans T30-4]|eukprot:XP_002906992.1 conserved hypothetical protein [Phytophthora infestans T30-4]
MASNGVKREDTANIKAEESSDDTQVKVEKEENKDSVKAESEGAALVKEEELETRKVKQEENGRVKVETASNGVKMEEKIKKQEIDVVEAAVSSSGELKVAVRGAKRNVKKDDVSKQREQQEDRSHIRRKAVSCDAALWDSIEWVVAAGAEVDAGQRLATAGRLEEGNQRPVQAPCKGRLYILTKEQSDGLMGDKEEAEGTVMRTVAFVEYCIHPLRNGRTCLMCLAVVDDDEENEDMESVNVVSHGQVIRLNVEEAKKFDSDNIRRQLGAKKLSLVLDLDHTLLHAVRVDDVVSEIKQTVLYDLFIYTHGTRLYAEKIVNIIDPDETYFKNRIVARTDTPDMLHKSLKLLFPSCDDSMILVLDDRIDVWKENEGNVFLIEPYHYFKCTSEINNASGRGVAGMEDSEAEASEDSHLAQSTTVLRHVHEAFYAGHETGMRGTTAEEQMGGHGRDVKGILSACARSWSRVSEKDFLADEWKAKHTKKEPEKKTEEACVPSGAETPSTNAPSTDASDGVDGSQSASPAVSAAEAKPVTGILVKREVGDAKRVKQVSFANVMDDSGNPPSEDSVVRKSKMVRRSRVTRRPSGAIGATGAVATGVVATGGTFDFLSKIKATKREPSRVSIKTNKAEETKQTPASSPKDMDDAFMRLMEAEERENEEEQKRKHSSKNIKDQLFSRRVKKESKRPLESDPTTTTRPGEKRMRVTSEQANGTADDEEGDDEELDDLEADILGDL